MTGKERISRIFRGEPVDRIGLFEHFWSDTYKTWQEQGHIPANTSLEDLFDYDMQLCWPTNLVADLDFQPRVLSETEDTYTALDGNGATLKRHKWHDTTPEHIAFSVTERAAWEEKIKPLLTPSPRRIQFEAYRAAREEAARKNRFFFWSGVNVFECMHPICGHEHMLIGMLDDPEWIQDMADTYAELTIASQKMLFEQEGYPDGIWFYEDMGYKGSPFMSPHHYRELIQPAHKKTIEYAHSLGLPVMMHSCGFVEPLLPDMVDAGIDGLQVIEIKAGMDPIRIHKRFGDRLVLMGGIDVRTLYTNDRAIIDRELEAKVPALMPGNRYILHSDHSIPNTVDFETYQYFVQKGLELGQYRG